MQKKRSRGILMHVSTLDGDFGCGSFGKEARAFVDLLHESGYEYWQTLPFGVPDASGSPYKSFSAFAGNPLFIDLPTLHENGLLTSSELEDEKMRYSRAPHIYKCDFEALTESRYALLRDVAARIKTENASLRASVEAFAESHPYLDGFCRYMSEVRTEILGGVHTGTPTSPADELFFYRFTQYEFFRQWQEIKKYAGENGVKIIGDIPIYVDLDSADVWQNPQYFDLDENKRPVKVAGVPPDYFSPEGQKWGNPVYDWDALEKDGFSW